MSVLRFEQRGGVEHNGNVRTGIKVAEKAVRTPDRVSRGGSKKDVGKETELASR